MPRDVFDYAQALVQLLPRGAAWSADRTSVLFRLLLGLAGQLVRVDRRAGDLVRESDPRATLELLLDWERVAGLPDECVGSLGVTVGERRDAVLGRLVARAGLSKVFYIDVAAALGFPITVDELGPLKCTDPCNGGLYTEVWRHFWRINAPAVTIRNTTCIDKCTSPLRVWGNELLECTILRIKPAHSEVLFAFGD